MLHAQRRDKLGQQVRQQLLLLAGGDDVALGRAETGEGSLGEGKHSAVVSTCMQGRSGEGSLGEGSTALW